MIVGDKVWIEMAVTYDYVFGVTGVKNAASDLLFFLQGSEK